MTLEQLWVADRSVAAAKDATLYLFLGRVLTNIVAHECFTPTKAAYICVDQPIIIFALATRRNNKLFGEAAGESSVVRETGTSETGAYIWKDAGPASCYWRNSHSYCRFGTFPASVSSEAVASGGVIGE
jgi:hypothetical protein